MPNMDSYPIATFVLGEQVWARNAMRKEVFWPAVVLDPEAAPAFVRRLMLPERACICYYGPSCAQGRERDYYWAKEGDVLPWNEYLEDMQAQIMPRQDIEEAFQAAMEEAQSVEKGDKHPVAGAIVEQVQGPRCSSCNGVLKVDEQDRAEQQDGRCTSCQRAYEAGQFCAVCGRVWLPLDRDMARCEGCSAWVHGACDALAMQVVKAGEDAAYQCPTCREARSQEAQQDLLQCYVVRLRDIRPLQPRDPFQIFSTLALRQYQEDGFVMDLRRLAPLIRGAWDAEEDKARYEASAEEEANKFQEQSAEYERLFQEYQELCDKLGQEPDASLALDPKRFLLSHGGLKLLQGGDRQRSGAGRDMKVEAVDIPEEVPVLCGSYYGTFLLASMRVRCDCAECARLPAAKREWSPTQWENHCGNGSAKKWKASIRVVPGSMPECPPHGTAMQIGRWMDIRGIEAKGNKPQLQFIATYRQSIDGSDLEASHMRPPNPPRAAALAGHQDRSVLANGAEHSTGGAGGPGAKGARPPGRPPKDGVKKEPGEWAPWNDAAQGNYKPIKVRWAGDRCCVCDSDVDYDCDQLVSCDGCGITAHQSCYGIPELPGVDDIWLCRACELREDGKPEPQCCLCPVVGGALKPTTLKGQWCHAACMQWIPEVTCNDPARMEPIDRITTIQKERWELQCCLCKQRMGAKIQCNSCYQAYHPLCARMAGLHMEMVDPPDGQGPLQLVSYCPRHCKPRPELAGISQVREDAQDEQEEDTNGLWNAQPFRQPPALPIPTCEAGAARATKFQWQRISHGTGIGATSTSGFWIPDGTAAPPGDAGDTGDAGADVAGDMEGHEGRKRPRGRQGKGKAPSGKPPRGFGGSAGGAAAGGAQRAVKQPAAPAELLPLPQGVPEELPVVCNSRTAIFVVRTQRILFQGQEMSASRFETVCGKGDAKKWKCSVFAINEHGGPGLMMQDWLARYQMDRAALAKLAANLSAVEAWQAWQREQAAGGAESGADGPDGAADGHDPGTPAVAQGGAGAGASSGREQQEGQQQQQQQQQRQGQEERDPEEAARPRRKQRLMSSSGSGTLYTSSSVQAKREPSPAADGVGAANGVAGSSAPGRGAAAHSCAADGATANGTAANGAAFSGQRPAAGPTAMDVDGMPVPGSSGQAGRPSNHAATPAAGSIAAAQTAAAGTPSAPQQEGADAAAGAAASPSPAPGPPKVKLLRLAQDEQAVGSYKLLQPETDPASSTAGTSTPLPDEQQQQQQHKEGPADLEQLAAANARIVPDGSGPEARVGLCCRVFWPDDNAWYEADVRSWDEAQGMHRLWYHADEMEEALDLLAEERACRVQWLPLVDKHHWPPAPSRQLSQQLLPRQAPADAPGLGPSSSKLQQQQQQRARELEAAAEAAEAAAAEAAAEVARLEQQAAGSEGSDEEEGSQIPQRLRVTAMQRDPTDAAFGINLLQLAASGVHAGQMLQQLRWGQAQGQRAAGGRYAFVPEAAPAGGAAVGWRIGIYFGDDACFYYGHLEAFHEASGGLLMHYDDDEREWVMLSLETLDWVRPDGEAMSRGARNLHRAVAATGFLERLQQHADMLNNARHAAKQQRRQAALAAARKAAATAGAAAAAAAEAAAAAKAEAAAAARQLPPQPPPQQQQQQHSEGEAAKPVPRADAPTTVPIICGGVVGTFDCQRMVCLLENGQVVSPTEFERMAGKASSKKWKASIRVRKGDGRPGITMGDWLIEQGYDAPKAAKAPDGASLDEVRRRQGRSQQQQQQQQFVRQGSVGSYGGGGNGGGYVGGGGGWVGPGGPGSSAIVRGRSSHREGCMCVICKQARRKAAQATGTAPDPADAYIPREEQRRQSGGARSSYTVSMAAGPAAASEPAREGYKVYGHASLMSRGGPGSSSKSAGPVIRSGKRAFVGAVPQLVRGPQQHRFWKVPQGRAWDPQDFFAARAAAAAAGAEAAGAAAVAGGPQAGAAAQGAAGAAVVKQEPGAAGAGPPATQQQASQQRAGGGASTSAAPSSSSTAIVSRPTTPSPFPGPGHSPAHKPPQQKVSWRERLRQCRATERERITFGKSGIHGWGIFAVADMKQDSLVSEFRGELVSSVVADLREKRYRAQGCDCYLFHVSNDVVFDSTSRGAYGRFTNHCCAPCLYTKVLQLEGETHLCFFARTDIKAGQELTYDYRFKEEEGDSKVRCQCGAPNCKGTLN